MPAATEAPPAPTTTAAPAPTALPASSADKPPQDYLGDIVGELQDMDAGTPPPPKPPKSTAKPSAKPAVEPPEPKPTDKPIEPEIGKVEEPESEKPSKPIEEPEKPVKAAELRAAYDGLKKEKREVLEPKIQKLEAKLKEYESRQPEDTKPIIEKMTAIEKRNSELEQHIQFLDYKRSKEFTEKYEQPFTEAWSKAVADFGQLSVKIPAGTDDATGEPKFDTREATQDDLIYLANLPLSQMDEQAEIMFGHSAARVIRHVERVRELSDAQNKALVEARNKAGEWSKTRQFKMQQLQQVQQSLWTQYNKEIVERFPNVFGPNEDDPDGNALLQKGYEFADQLFAPSRDAAPLTPEQRIQRDALMRHKIANHDRLVLGRKKDKARIAELEKALAEYERSEPRASSPGSGPKATDKPWDETVADELRALDK